MIISTFLHIGFQLLGALLYWGSAPDSAPAICHNNQSMVPKLAQKPIKLEKNV